MSSVFIICQLSVANLKHIGIVPCARSCVLIKPKCALVNVINNGPIGSYIVGCSPHIACLCAPIPRVRRSPFAKGENNRLFSCSFFNWNPSCCVLESLAHSAILNIGAVCLSCNRVFYNNLINSAFKPNYKLGSSCCAEAVWGWEKHLVCFAVYDNLKIFPAACKLLIYK